MSTFLSPAVWLCLGRWHLRAEWPEHLAERQCHQGGQRHLHLHCREQRWQHQGHRFCLCERCFRQGEVSFGHPRSKQAVPGRPLARPVWQAGCGSSQFAFLLAQVLVGGKVQPKLCQALGTQIRSFAPGLLVLLVSSQPPSALPGHAHHSPACSLDILVASDSFSFPRGSCPARGGQCLPGGAPGGQRPPGLRSLWRPCPCHPLGQERDPRAGQPSPAAAPERLPGHLRDSGEWQPRLSALVMEIRAWAGGWVSVREGG